MAYTHHERLSALDDSFLEIEDASAKIRKGNYERIFDEGRRRVRAWEKANVQ